MREHFQTDHVAVECSHTVQFAHGERHAADAQPLSALQGLLGLRPVRKRFHGVLIPNEYGC